MDPLRFYLLAGLIAHKLVWEVMKRRTEASTASRSAGLTFVKMVKIAILVGILGQTLLPDILPLASDAFGLRVAGGFLYTAGLALALTGRIQLGDNWLDIENAAIKRGQRVICNGVYGYVRHPIYAGDMLLLVGLELALNSWLVILAVLLMPVIFRQTIREEHLLRNSLPGYAGYCERTKRFIPFVA